jgi:lysine 6-dehydrogenase
MKMLVLGAGLQGSACAFDLLQHPEVASVRLAGLPLDRLPPFLRNYEVPRLIPTPVDARDQEAVRALIREADAVLCALPYHFNLEMARLAVEEGVHYCDLGGNTGLVLQQRGLDAEARAAGISVVPDCGLAPGMVNILAEEGIRSLDSAEEVRCYVGGLPQAPEPPLFYQVVYSLEGVLDYYTTPSLVLRGGCLHQVAALSEVEEVHFAEPIGRLEAFHTSGGISTMPYRYEGKVATMEYKTLRFPGHLTVVRALRDLGFFDSEPVSVDGHRVPPRQLSLALLDRHLRKPDGRDLVALRVLVRGVRGGRRLTVRWELVDWYDEEHGVSAMMRTTGYSLAITALMQVQGKLPPGVHTPDEAVPAQEYVAQLRERGVALARFEES